MVRIMKWKQRRCALCIVFADKLPVDIVQMMEEVSDNSYIMQRVRRAHSTLGFLIPTYIEMELLWCLYVKHVGARLVSMFEFEWSLHGDIKAVCQFINCSDCKECTDQNMENFTQVIRVLKLAKNTKFMNIAR